MKVSVLFPSGVLFSKEICYLPTVWVDLRYLLDSKGAVLAQHYSSRVIMILSYGLYDDVEDRKEVVKTAQIILEASHGVSEDLRNNGASVQTNVKGRKNSENGPKDLRRNG